MVLCGTARLRASGLSDPVALLAAVSNTIAWMTHKTWGGRFDGATDKLVEEFTQSIEIDRRLYRHDIDASKAHALMLADVRLITAEEAGRISQTLDAIG